MSRLSFPPGSVEPRSFQQRFMVPPPSSIDLAKLLDVHPGETVLDLGCGSGLLSIAAAKLGASRSWLSISIRDPLLQPSTMPNGMGFTKGSKFLAGSWFEALREWSQFKGHSQTVRCHHCHAAPNSWHSAFWATVWRVRRDKTPLRDP